MFCPKCNTENRDSARYCDYCGTKFTKDSEGNALVEQDEESKLPLLMKIAAVIIIIAIILTLLFLVLGGKGAGAASASGVRTAVIANSTTTIIAGAKNGTSYTSDLYYISNTVLAGNIATTGNVTIKRGVVLTTDGYSIIAGGTFNNLGTVNAGNPGNNAPQSAKGMSYPYSYGGSGGSGGGGRASSDGSTPQNPSIGNSQIAAWYYSGFINYLTGAGGGGACKMGSSGAMGGSTLVPGGNQTNTKGYIPCQDSSGTSGASGSYGIYIQANRIIAGTINANGQQALPSQADAGGGGGGGVLVLAYGQGGFVAGNYDVSGGAAQQDSGAGGNGQVWIYSYGSTPPITP